MIYNTNIKISKNYNKLKHVLHRNKIFKQNKWIICYFTKKRILIFYYKSVQKIFKGNQNTI